MEIQSKRASSTLKNPVKTKKSDEQVSYSTGDIREVFIGDATNCAETAAKIRELVAKKKANPSQAKEIEKQLFDLREGCGHLINVEDSTCIYQGTKVIVRLNNCWKDKDGRPYQMICTLCDWLHFGKPFADDIYQKPSTENPFHNQIKQYIVV